MSSNLDILSNWLLNTEKQHVGIVIGDVIGISPIRIQYGDRIILEPTDLCFASGLIEGYQGEYEDDNGTNVVTKGIAVTNSLEIGDKVMMIPDNNLKRWYVIDKLIRGGSL